MCVRAHWGPTISWTILGVAAIIRIYVSGVYLGVPLILKTTHKSPEILPQPLSFFPATDWGGSGLRGPTANCRRGQLGLQCSFLHSGSRIACRGLKMYVVQLRDHEELRAQGKEVEP